MRVQGKLKKFKSWERGSELFYLEHQQLKKGMAVFCSEKIRRRQKMKKIKKVDHLQIEGFVTFYIKDYKCKSEE